jgi:hypothetical protein
MKEDAHQDASGSPLGAVKDSLEMIVRKREHAEKRLGRVSVLVAVAAGAAVSTGAFAAGLASGLVVLCAVIPGVLTGLVSARARYRAEERFVNEEASLLRERMALHRKLREQPRSPRVRELIQSILWDAESPIESKASHPRRAAAG